MHGVQTVTGGEGERFVTRMALRFPFLHPDRIMDANKRRPGHPDHDTRTLFIPSNWFKASALSLSAYLDLGVEIRC